MYIDPKHLIRGILFVYCVYLNNNNKKNTYILNTILSIFGCFLLV